MIAFWSLDFRRAAWFLWMTFFLPALSSFFEAMVISRSARARSPSSTACSTRFTWVRIADFKDLNAEVLGCSPDSPESHRNFIAKHDLGVRLLSDPDHVVMEAYGAWGEKNMYGRVTVGVIRSTVIIDPKGRVAHRWKRVKSKGHAEKVRERLESLQS